jgi:hypothetical protein
MALLSVKYVKQHFESGSMLFPTTSKNLDGAKFWAKV